MTLSRRTSTLAASISLAIGIVFALFPRNWMDLWLATDPDGGSGFYELLMIAFFEEASAGEDDNTVGHAYGRETVGDEQGHLSQSQLREALKDL